jgi:hypothetical protein
LGFVSLAWCVQAGGQVNEDDDEEGAEEAEAADYQEHDGVDYRV